MQGSGSQQICKQAQAPLFAPQKNMGWAHGTPNMSDFYQSRVNPGRNMSNVKPFETENVGPGLNRGYTTAGSGGYNAGMEARERSGLRNQWMNLVLKQIESNLSEG